jgi:hypothetical protein
MVSLKTHGTKRLGPTLGMNSRFYGDGEDRRFSGDIKTQMYATCNIIRLTSVTGKSYRYSLQYCSIENVMRGPNTTLSWPI